MSGESTEPGSGAPASMQFMKKVIWITPAFQLVGNPGYNQDRGPIVVGVVRVHAEF
jgi:hypothetical protein